MGKIKQLDKQLANKIAAGEVIERPANVVKELVENSIDANSHAISIYIEDGGLTLVKVLDDGDGMDKVDAKLCFSTHATSKIKDDFDLFNITTLGFRGEAIPSIASISHFSLKTSQGESGIQINYEFGELKEELFADAKKGTTIEVTKLFQNVPARLKYMKSVNVEFSHIQSFIEKFALAHPEIAFNLYHQNRLVFKTNGNGQLLEVIGQIYGLGVAKNMLPVSNHDTEFTISGYISRIDTSRASKANIITLINQRVVKNVMSVDAINQAYRDYLSHDRFPIAFINIEIDPYLVDVNVHPAKMEVRFSKESQLKTLVYNTVKETLQKYDLTYQPKNKETEKETYNRNYQQSSFELKIEEPQPIYEPTSSIEISKETTSYFESPVFRADETKTDELKNQMNISIDENNIQNNTPIIQEEPQKPIKKKIYAKCQIHGSYIVGENQEGLYLVDQHAAKERVNYEYYKSKFAKFVPIYQDLLIPLIFEFPHSEFLVLLEKKDLLLKVGIELEQFGTSSFTVKKLPIWIKHVDEKKYIDDMIEQILTQNKVDLLSLQEYAIASLSCKASLKANTYLTITDMQAILDDLMRCDNPYVCPHGRPTVIFYSGYELEKLFKRVV